MIGLSKCAALEYANQGIRINVVCPGAITTAALEKYYKSYPDAEKNILRKVPVGRGGTPVELAQAVLWLCSDASSFVYGHTMVMDGGLMLPLQ